MIVDNAALLEQIRQIHAAIRAAVVAATEQQSLEQLATAVAYEGGDTIFQIDRVSEAVLLDQFATLAERWPLILIAEGLGKTGRTVLPAGTAADQAVIQVIVDPIDGTRGLMYQKRPAFILTGVAPNRGEATSLADIELAVLTEIPLVKQHLSDQFWAIAGQGAFGERRNRLDGATTPLVPQPSQAATIAQGYGNISRFFPGSREVLAAIDDALVAQVLGPTAPGTAPAFEDQYICTGGQIYELLMGHDRWVADLRPLVEPMLHAQGRPLGLCCHPYDICVALVASEAGLILTDGAGQPLDAPLDVDTPVSWIGYANQQIASQIASPLHSLLATHGLLMEDTDVSHNAAAADRAA